MIMLLSWARGPPKAKVKVQLLYFWIILWITPHYATLKLTHTHTHIYISVCVCVCVQLYFKTFIETINSGNLIM